VGTLLAKLPETTNEDLPLNPTANQTQDPMDQYAATVGTLHAKLGRVVSNQQEVADSLSRAVAALRSIAAAKQQK